MRKRLIENLTAALALAVSVVPTPVQAQGAASTRVPEQAVRRWELEGYGGFSLGRLTSGGELTLPPAGDPITTSSPVFPSWSVPSWFFGDGAAFLNNVMADFNLSSRVTPLDGSLQQSHVNDAGSFLTGLRFRRAFGRPWSVEVGLEISAQSMNMPDDLAAGLDASSSTFRSVFSELLSTGPFASPVVQASATSASSTQTDMTITAALNYAMKPAGAWEPYAVFGGGIVVPVGNSLTAGVTGNYRFLISGSIPVDETDSLTVRYRGRVTFVAVAGGGVRRAIGDRWGVRVDARLLTGPATNVVAVDAAPVVVTGTPAGFIESFTYPNLQFSNNSSTNRRSTLGPPGLDDEVVFKADWQLRGRATVGLYFQF